ncbi:hypothetical protein CR51_36290 [Caballeronia megalochromosomata]|jgi:hypothetical protein|nr:hypothetical protein CR51_36290 [Caballeronia megalochromosomata]
MNPAQRKFMVFLALFGVLGALVALWGFGRRADPSGAGTNRERAEQFTPAPPLRMMSTPLIALRPKLKLDQREFVVGAAARPVTIPVPAQPESKQRFGRFTLSRGLNGQIDYHDDATDTTTDLKDQQVLLPAQANRDNIIAMHAGGRLTLICRIGPTCVFELN